MIYNEKAVKCFTAFFIMNKENLVLVIGGTGAIGKAVADELSNLGFEQILTFLFLSWC